MIGCIIIKVHKRWGAKLDKRILEISDLFKRKRKFGYIQIGVSSRCLLACRMCPRTCFSDRWNSTDMTFDAYKKITDSLSLTQNVYLSGWGEPLLNPHFKEMLRSAKKADCMIGFTTNGALLSKNMMMDLVRDQVDLISISLAGASTESHESKRVGSNFQRITEKLVQLHSLKAEARSEKPLVLMLFMMFKDNLNELSNIVELAAKVKADRVVATNLDYVGHPDQDKLKAFSCGHAPIEDVKEVQDALELAEELNVHFNAFPLEMDSVQICSEDPLNNLYISEEGDVSPCVYLNLPLDPIKRIFCGRKTIIPRLRFGNIKENSLLDIWENREYVSFRRHYEQRKRNRKASLPEPCKTCYKAYGI